MKARGFRLLLGGQFMNDKLHQAFQGMEWIVVTAIMLISISVTLNIVVAQTLASLSLASVILALYVALLAYALGGIALIFVSIRVLLPSLTSTFAIAVKVFQLRVVTDTPKTRSNIPRYPITLICRLYRPTTNRSSLPRIFTSHLPLVGKCIGIDGIERGDRDRTLTKRTMSGRTT
jgi:hypothetical protein